MKILFFDTETNGLPDSFKSPPEMFPRLVSLSYILTTQDNRPFVTVDHIVKPDGFTIPPDMIHGISHERALEEGRPLLEVMEHFGKTWKQADLVVCHNVEFDFNIVDGESHRLWGKYFLRRKPSYCTQKGGAELLKIPGKYGSYKWASLSELHQYLFEKDFEDAHKSLNDVTATMNCFFEMQKRGHINPLQLI